MADVSAMGKSGAVHEHTTHCAGCLTSSSLAMFAHRREGKLIGWIFLCSSCAANGQLKMLVFLEKEDEEEM